jgi:hypothetical protein
VHAPSVRADCAGRPSLVRSRGDEPSPDCLLCLSALSMASLRRNDHTCYVRTVAPDHMPFRVSISAERHPNSSSSLQRRKRRGRASPCGSQSSSDFAGDRRRPAPGFAVIWAGLLPNVRSIEPHFAAPEGLPLGASCAAESSSRALGGDRHTRCSRLASRADRYRSSLVCNESYARGLPNAQVTHGASRWHGRGTSSDLNN